MSLPVALVALLIGVIIWAFLVSKLTAKPWEPTYAAPRGATGAVLHGTLGDDVGAEEISTPDAARIGLWMFLGVVTALFGLFISAYLMRRGHGPLGQGSVASSAGSIAKSVPEHAPESMGSDWRSLPMPPILWVNTAVLVLGSIAMQWARAAVGGGHVNSMRRGFIAAGLLTMIFLIGQVVAWRQLDATAIAYGYCGTFAGGSNPDPVIAFFYLLTTAHGLHLLGGLYVWSKTAIKMARDGMELIDVRLSVELCTVYWHYLLLVWLVLFALLLAT